MTKLEELEKKKERREVEAEKAEQQVKKYQESAKLKRLEIKQIEAEILSETLVQSGLTLSDLQELIGLKNSPEQASAVIQEDEGEN